MTHWLILSQSGAIASSMLFRSLPGLFDVIVRQKNRYQNETVLEYFNNLIQMNAQFTDIDFDTLHSGARRINILVSGTITYNSNGIRVSSKFTEFIHLSTKKEKDKDMEIWIQMSMMKII